MCAPTPEVPMSILLFALLGCHAKFKKNAPDLHQVRVQIVNTGGPYVTLGKVHAGEHAPAVAHMAALAVNVAQTVNEINVAEDFARRVDPAPLNQTMTQGLLETIQNGPPFELTTDPQVKHTLQIEVLSYGLYVPYLGAPGQFTFDVQARLYRGDTGKRVYSTSLSCDTAAGDPSAAEVVFSAVNNVRELDQMSDEQLQATFNDMAYYCGTYFATRMRRHAG
jgi:hypothetical protein